MLPRDDEEAFGGTYDEGAGNGALLIHAAVFRGHHVRGCQSGGRKTPRYAFPRACLSICAFSRG